MTFEEIGKTFQNIIKENIELVDDVWESFPSEMKEKVQKEIEKVKEQVLEYQQQNKEEQPD